MNEIDYGALYGVEDTTSSVETAEVADQPDTTEAQGAEEQDIAAPAVEAGAETGEQSPEERSKYAAARRKAEAEKDAAVAQAKAEAKAEADRYLDEVFKNSGIINPYTKKPVTSKAEFDEYKAKMEAEKRRNIVKKSGLSDEEFDEFVNNLPDVKNAKEAVAKAEAAEKVANEAKAKARVDEQLKEISALDPTVKEMADLAKMPEYDAFYALVKKGISLTEAFKIATYDRQMQKAASVSKQQALNAANSKSHMTPTQQRGAGAVTVPGDVAEAYRAFNPGATDAEIQRHYNQYLKK